jgi:recombination protein RecT
MSVATTGNGQIQRREEKPEATLVRLLETMKTEIARALPKHVTPDRMARVTLTALRTTKDLAKCTPQSFLACVMTLSQLGLEPSNGLGFAWLIPRKNKKLATIECTVIIGYQGLMELARRSGQIRSISATAVYEGDDYEVRYGLHPDVTHRPNWTAPRTPGKLVGAYAVARVKDSDDPIFVFVPRLEIEAARKRGASGAGVSTPWDTDYEAMALKTAVRRLFRWLPKSVEMAIASVADDAPTPIAASAEIAHALDVAGLDALPSDTTPETLDTTVAEDASAEVAT